MSKQTLNGKAFEYACLDSISSRYENRIHVIKDETPAYLTAQNAFSSLDSDHKRILIDGAKKGLELIERLEPNLMVFEDNDKLFLSIQTDSAGQRGDVRDIIIKKESTWEIGISAKHNHEAVKHSRLSPSIDFGEKWLNLNCSNEYFDEINRVFSLLEDYKGLKWNEVNIDKSSQVYKPLLDAFMKELMSLYNQHEYLVPQRLVKYLLGEYDFYKFILDVSNETIKVNAYNMLGTLNNKVGTVSSSINLPILQMPTRIFHFDYIVKNGTISENTIELICNNGWQFSFRIHNASSKVETSMKFDIQLIGVPISIHSFM